jgi:hypothetical protein
MPTVRPNWPRLQREYNVSSRSSCGLSVLLSCGCVGNKATSNNNSRMA